MKLLNLISKLIRFNLLALTTLGLSSCIVQATKSYNSTKTYGGSGSSSSNSYGKWNFLPLSIRISADFDSGEISHMKSYSGAWESAMTNGKDLFNFSGSTIANKNYSNSNSYLSDSYIEVHRVYNSTAIPSGALAITAYGGYYYNSGTSSEYFVLAKADILFNEYEYDFSTDGTSGTYDIASIMTHEMGHLLGINHVAFSTNSIMNPALNESTFKRNLTSKDRSMINALYSTSTNTSALTAGGQALSAQREDIRGEYVTGIHQLKANGECEHYENGKLVHSHKFKF